MFSSLTDHVMLRNTHILSQEKNFALFTYFDLKGTTGGLPSLRKNVEPFWKTVPPWRVEPFFPLIIMFGKKTAPPSEVAPFPKTAPGVDLFLDKNSSTFERGTKIVPGVELSYVLWNGSRGGAVLAPLFSQWWLNTG